MQKLTILICIILIFSSVPQKVYANANDVEVSFVQEFAYEHNGNNIYRLVFSVTSPDPVFLAAFVFSYCNYDIVPVVNSAGATPFADIGITSGSTRADMFRSLPVLGTGGSMINANIASIGLDGWVVSNGRSTVAYSLTYFFNFAAGNRQLFSFYYRVIGSKDADTFMFVNFSETVDPAILQMSEQAGVHIAPSTFIYALWGHRDSAASNIPMGNVVLNYTNSHIVRRILQNVDAGGDIYDIPNGTPYYGLGLPDTVDLITLPELPPAYQAVNVSWDVSAYDISNTDSQTFDAIGTIILPVGVRDPNGISVVVIRVTVDGATDPPTNVPVEPPTDIPNSPPADTPAESPSDFPYDPPSGSSGSSNGDELTPPDTPTEPRIAAILEDNEPQIEHIPLLTVAVNDTYVEISFFYDEQTVLFHFLDSQVQNILYTTEGVVYFDMSQFGQITTVVLPYRVILAFLHAEMGVKFVMPYAYLYISAEMLHEMAQTMSENIIIPLNLEAPYNESYQKTTILYLPILSHYLSMHFALGHTSFLVNGMMTQGDAAPFLIYDTGELMLPLRVIAETFGATVTWCYATQTVNISYMGQEFYLTTLDQTIVMIENARTFIPSGDIADMLEVTIEFCNRGIEIYRVL